MSVFIKYKANYWKKCKLYLHIAPDKVLSAIKSKKKTRGKLYLKANKPQNLLCIDGEFHQKVVVLTETRMRPVEPKAAWPISG